jgi:hypothetical protein
MECDVMHAYECMGYDVAAIQNQLMGIASQVKEMPVRTEHEIGSTYCVNRVILWSESNHVNHISEEVLSNLEGQIKISVDTILYSFSAETHFPEELQVMYCICLWVCSRGN